VHEADKNMICILQPKEYSQVSLNPNKYDFFTNKPTEKPNAYIAGKPTLNVGVRFPSTEEYSRYF
jgi:hypothetical protein